MPKVGHTARRRLRIPAVGRRDPAPSAGRRSRPSEGIDERHTRKVLDLTVRLAEVMLSSGAGTADVVVTAQDVAAAYRLHDCVIDVFVTTIFASALPTHDSPPVTIVRSAHARSTDYSRLAELDRLVRRITYGGVSVDQAHEAMDELTQRPHPYPRWVATAGWAGFALGIAMLFGGTWLTCLLAALTSAVIDRVNRRLHRLGTPLFFQQAAGAFLATLVAVVAYLYADQGPTALVATGIVMLLSGLTLVGSVQDALTGYMLTAVARLGDVLFMTAGIVVGILAGLQVAELADITIKLHVDATEAFILPRGPGPIALAVSGAALAGACMTIACYARLRAVATAGIVAGLAELVLIGFATTGFGQVVATGTAAAGVGLLATLSSIRRQAPALVTATAGITPMLPGLAVFRAVFYFAVDKDYAQGIAQAAAAAATALAIGSGVVLGELLGSPLRYRAGWLGKLLRVRGAPGLRRAVGRAVRLRPTETFERPGADTERTVSVALEPTPADDNAAADVSDPVMSDPPDPDDGGR